MKGWRGKVMSIGAHCGKPTLAADHFERLGDNAETIMDRLSSAKQAAMDRRSLLESFHQGLLMLNALLESVDETKVRKA